MKADQLWTTAARTASSSLSILTIAGIGADADDADLVDLVSLGRVQLGLDPDENPSTPDGIYSRCPSPRTTPRKPLFRDGQQDDMLTPPSALQPQPVQEGFVCGELGHWGLKADRVLALLEYTESSHTGMA